MSTWQRIAWTTHAATTLVAPDDTITTGRRVVAEFEREDEARLAEAAPDMLEALHEALAFIAHQEDVSDGGEGQQVPNKAMRVAQTLRAAVTKATGEQP